MQGSRLVHIFACRKQVSELFFQPPDGASDAEHHQHRCHGQSDEVTEEQPRRPHTERESEQITHRQVEHPIREEGDRRDDAHILQTAQDADRDVLQTVRQLVERHEEHQFRRDGDDFGIGREELRNVVAQGDECHRCKAAPGKNQMIGCLGCQRQLADVACSVAVRNPDGRRRTDGGNDHPGAVVDRDGDLVGADGQRAQPAHHDGGADERGALQKHLRSDRRTDPHERAHGFPMVVAERESLEIGPVAVARTEVTDHQQRRHDAGQQRSQTGSRGAHFGHAEMPVDEHPVEPDIGEVRDDGYDEFRMGVADALQELFEGEKEHDERHAVRQQPIVGQCHIDHLDRLPEAIKQRNAGQLQEGRNDAEQRVEQDAVLKQDGRIATVALGEKLADERRQPHRHADGRDEKDEGNRAAESDCREGYGIIAAILADHDVIGQLGQYLADLGQYDRQCQPDIGGVLRSVCFETVHRGTKIRKVEGRSKR